jgi:hypothetical protein
MGRPLATHLVIVGGINPLREAMRGYVAGFLDHMVCLVERDGDSPDADAFGLMYVLPDESGPEIARQRGAGLILMAPTPNSDAQVAAWVSLTHELAASAAERGVHHIVADVHEGGVEAAILQSAGFVPMLQQSLYKRVKLSKDGGKGKSKAGVAPRPVPGLRPATKDDEPLIRALHIRSAPKMTYHAEHSSDALFGLMRVQRQWVLIQHNEVVGYVGLWHGRRGRAMRCLFRPGAEEMAESVIRNVLAQDAYQRATYCAVRHYQQGLHAALDQLGFVHVAATTLLVRHTAPRVTAPVWSAVPEIAAIRANNPVSYKVKTRDR